MTYNKSQVQLPFFITRIRLLKSTVYMQLYLCKNISKHDTIRNILEVLEIGKQDYRATHTPGPSCVTI